MKLHADHPFRRHAENLAAVKKGLVQVERLHRDAIRWNRLAEIETVSRLHALVIGMLAEAKLRAITWDPDGFNDRERHALLADSQIVRWQRTVEAAFRRHFSVPFHRDLDQFTIGARPAQQYHDLIQLLTDRLEPVISDRNKTAHGQWLWHLNSKETQIARHADPTPNYSALRARSSVINSIGDLVHVLAVSEPTFSRDYATVLSRIDSLVPQLDGKGYPAYVAQLQRNRRPAE
jgi:hypothetical protein